MAIDRPSHAWQLVELAALPPQALVVLLGAPVEGSWGTPFSWSTLGRPRNDIGVRPMDPDTTLAGLNSLLCSVVVTCDAATHLGVGLHVLHSVKIHYTEIA